MMTTKLEKVKSHVSSVKKKAQSKVPKFLHGELKRVKSNIQKVLRM